MGEFAVLGEGEIHFGAILGANVMQHATKLPTDAKKSRLLCNQLPNGRSYRSREADQPVLL
jgi:hypothetical protein